MDETQNYYTRFNRVLSYALHPFLLPSIAVALLLFSNSIMSLVPISVKWFLLGTVAVNTLLIPACCIGLLHTFKLIPDLHLHKPGQRVIPLIVVAVCYLICTWMLSDVLTAFLIRRFLIAALGCVLFALTLNFFWKVSLHMTAMGGLIAMFVVLNISGFMQMYGTMLLFILLAGALGSARLALGAHNGWQVSVGFAGGFLISAACLLLL